MAPNNSSRISNQAQSVANQTNSLNGTVPHICLKCCKPFIVAPTTSLLHTYATSLIESLRESKQPQSTQLSLAQSFSRQREQSNNSSPGSLPSLSSLSSHTSPSPSLASSFPSRFISQSPCLDAENPTTRILWEAGCSCNLTKLRIDLQEASTGFRAVRDNLVSLFMDGRKPMSSFGSFKENETKTKGTECASTRSSGSKNSMQSFPAHSIRRHSTAPAKIDLTQTSLSETRKNNANADPEKVTSTKSQSSLLDWIAGHRSSDDSLEPGEKKLRRLVVDLDPPLFWSPLDSSVLQSVIFLANLLESTPNSRVGSFESQSTHPTLKHVSKSTPSISNGFVYEVEASDSTLPSILPPFRSSDDNVHLQSTFNDITTTQEFHMLLRLPRSLAFLALLVTPKSHTQLTHHLKLDKYRGCDMPTLRKEYRGLNSDQQTVVERVLRMQDYCLLLGMPGTGKSSTVAFLVRCLLACGLSVLLSAYTHSAVDTVLLKVSCFR